MYVGNRKEWNLADHFTFSQNTTAQELQEVMSTSFVHPKRVDVKGKNKAVLVRNSGLRNHLGIYLEELFWGAYVAAILYQEHNAFFVFKKYSNDDVNSFIHTHENGHAYIHCLNRTIEDFLDSMAHVIAENCPTVPNYGSGTYNIGLNEIQDSDLSKIHPIKRQHFKKCKSISEGGAQWLAVELLGSKIGIKSDDDLHDLHIQWREETYEGFVPDSLVQLPRNRYVESFHASVEDLVWKRCNSQSVPRNFAFNQIVQEI
jgi:hypothetical protein